MKSRGLLFPMISILLLLPFMAEGQLCSNRYGPKGNDMIWDRRCSPVTVQWTVHYSDVDDAGVSLEILFDWDDGSQDYVTAVEVDPVTNKWQAVASHTYTSKDLRCLYNPSGALVVNGEVCEASTQEQQVYVWDKDNLNGGYVSADPNVYPVCIGNGATMRFADNTQFNCVPPQLNDDPNTETRWIQWIYGTSNSMSGADVRVGGVVHSYPWAGPVIRLDGPVTGSSEVSLPIQVGNDNKLGEEFEVELRYWNVCNPYEPVYNDYVADRSVIRIVGNPDPTISPEGPVCEFDPVLAFSAATGGGTWSGPGITDAGAGTFDPSIAGAGTHLIFYNVTDGNNCSASDQSSIEVIEAPDGSISPEDPLCLDGAPLDLESATPSGTWSGTGITDVSLGIFDPAVAGLGVHPVVFRTDTDAQGCFGTDTIDLRVMPPPDAAFITGDSAWCQQETNFSFGTVVFSGSEGMVLDLVYEMAGRIDTLTGITTDTMDFLLNNSPGKNIYVLHKVIEWHGSNACEKAIADTLVMMVHPIPDATIELIHEGPCSPVPVTFRAEQGYRKYTWDFGAGPIETSSRQMQNTFSFSYTDNYRIVGNDTIYDLSRDDSTFTCSLVVETFAGCIDSVTTQLTVYPAPDVNFHVHPDIQNYPDSSVQLNNLSSIGNWDYLWSFGDGSTSTEKDPLLHTYRDYGIFDITLKGFNAHCADSMTRRIQILPPPPLANFRPDTMGCPPLSVKFFNNSKYAESYVWDFDDGRFSYESNPEHVFIQHREFYVKLVAIGLSGTDTSTRLVYVYDRPQADFSVYPTSSENLKQLFKFSNNSFNASTYLWDFGDGTTSAEAEPTHIYQDSGTYTVTLYAWSPQECPDTLVKKGLIRVKAGEGSVEFPTAFVWNGNGPSGGHWQEGIIDNTVFHPAVVNASELKLEIYNRWGERLFTSNEVYVGWDGYLDSGELAKEGVYFWKAWVKYVDGMEEILVGDITFLH